MKTLRTLMLIACCVCWLGEAWCQKKEINAAKDQLKAGNNLPQAQQSLETLLKDSVNRNNLKIWSLLYDIVVKQYEQGNEKLYLKQAYDTASLFNLAKKLFEVADGLDSVEMEPDKKGRVRLKYRNDHSEYLHMIRPNLLSGGLWMIGKQRYAEAYRFLDIYIDCARQPLFKSKNYQETDPNLPEAAYWSVYCGYKMQDPKATLHHSYEALKDTAHYNYMLQYLAETYKLENDTARYERALLEGFQVDPKFPFFYPRLIEFYTINNEVDKAMYVTEQALETDSTNTLFMFTKTTLLLNKEQYDECIKLCNQIIAMTDSVPGPYLNAGLAYYYKAIKLDKKTQVSNKVKKSIQSYYQKALPYMERYRAMVPNDQQRWAFPLYTIYLNLNMGAEFDEMEKIIKKHTNNKH